MTISNVIGLLTSLTVIIGVITTVYKVVKYFHPDEDTWQDKLAIVLCIAAFGLAGFGIFYGVSYGTATALPVTRQPVPVLSTVIPNLQPTPGDQQVTPAVTSTPTTVPTAGATSTVIPRESPAPTGTTALTPTPTPQATQGVTPAPSPMPSTQP